MHTDPIEPSALSPGEQPLEFVAKKKVGREAAFLLVGGAFGLVCGMAVFLLLLLTPRDSGFMPGLIGGVACACIFMIARAVFLLRSPCRVVLDTRGVLIEGRIARTFIEWSEIAEIRRDRTADLRPRDRKDVLVLCGKKGRPVARIAATFADFPVLVAEIEARSTRARGAPTYDRERAIQERRRKAKRSAHIAIVVCTLFLLLGIGVAGDGVNTVIHQRALAREGLDVEAKITRHYLYNITPHLEYAFQDTRGETHKRDVVMQQPMWDVLEKAATVNVRYLHSDPDWSVVDDEERMSMEGGPAIVMGLVCALFSGVLVVGIALGYTGVEIKDGKIRWKRIQDLDDRLLAESPGEPVVPTSAAAVLPPAQPAGQPLPQMPGPPRGIRILGVLNIVFGLLGVAFNVVKLAVLMHVDVQVWSTESIELSARSTTLVSAQHTANLVLATFLLMSGVAMLGRQAWGQKVALAAAAGQILMGLVGAASLVYNFTQSVGEFLPHQRMYVIVAFVAALILELLGLVYPLVLVVLLRRPLTYPMPSQLEAR
jgi:hypothetical protein